MIHRVRDIEEMLKELAGDVLVNRIVQRELEGDAEHVEAIHRHPTGSVGLLEASAGGQWFRAIEDADVIEAEKATFENIVAGGVLTVHPPGEIHEQLVEGAFEKLAIMAAHELSVDLVDAPARPGVNGRVDVAESPLVRGYLPVGMHVPLAEEDRQLAFSEAGIDHRHRDHVEGRVPGCKPRI